VTVAIVASEATDLRPLFSTQTKRKKTMNKDPRQRTHVLTLSQCQGDIGLAAGAIESVSRDPDGDLVVQIKGHMTLYVDNNDGLHAELLRSMAACAEYADAQAELAAEAIK
jgi:hypothetical protein